VKTCPECLNKVNDIVRVCKYCGHIFHSQPLAPPAPVKRTLPKLSFTCSLIIALAVLATLSVVYYASVDGFRSQPKPTADPATPIDAVIMCDQFVKDILKAPKTAEFQNVYQAESTETTPDNFTVTSYVDAENVFGALIRTSFTCKVRYVGNDEWQLDDLEIDE